MSFYEPEIRELVKLSTSAEDTAEMIEQISAEFISINDVKEKVSELFTGTINTLKSVSNLILPSDKSSKDTERTLRHISSIEVTKKGDNYFVKTDKEKAELPKFIKIRNLVVAIPVGSIVNMVDLGNGLISVLDMPSKSIDILDSLYAKTTAILNSKQYRESNRPGESIDELSTENINIIKDFMKASMGGTKDFSKLAYAYGNYPNVITVTDMSKDIARRDITMTSKKLRKSVNEITAVIEEVVKRNDSNKLDNISKATLISLLNDVKASSELVSLVATIWYISSEYANTHYQNVNMLGKKFK